MKKVLEPETADLINKMQEQLFAIEKKLDTLISKSSSGVAEKRSFAGPFQQSSHPRDRDDRRHDNNFRDRVLHKAVCAECKKECEVPFRPSGDRPVYCKECFAKRKAASSYSDRPDNRRERPSYVSDFSTDSRHGGKKKKFFENKKFYKTKKPAHNRKKSKK